MSSIGEIISNNKGQQFIIIGKNHEKSNKKHTYYNIKFVDSGYEDCVRSDSINKGLVRDKLEKSCCGVGSIGYINTNSHKHEYRIWENMMYRCYFKDDKSYKYYGAKGVSVCKRWHRFDYFVLDIKNISGYDEKLFNEYKLRLDKDILSIDSKIYSPKTTMWVSNLTNQKKRENEHNEKNRKFAIFPDGHTEQIFHVTDFCIQHGLHRQNVNLCLSGKQKSTKGFRFYKE